MQHIVELIPKVPMLPYILEKLDSKEQWLLQPYPHVLVLLICVIVYESGVPAVLPFVIVLGDFV